MDAHPEFDEGGPLCWQNLTKSDLPGEPHYPERIYNYYCVHLKQTPQPAFVMDISDQWERKAQAIACYHSQFVAGRSTDPVGRNEQLVMLPELQSLTKR